jgi:hypothetical protein
MNTKATAHIARNKSRLKSYGENVYLKNGDTFEIELFNGYTTEVLAKIWINDELISRSGLILKPGQRYFLERFIDTNNKFKFDTYEVENSAEVKEAIKSNGAVKVEFYQKTVVHNNNSIINLDLWQKINQPTIKPYVGTPYWTNQPYYGNITLTNSIGFSSDQNVFYNTSISMNVPGEEAKASLETGRVEKGEASDQSFTTVSMDFNSWPSDTVNMQILPVSQQPIEVSQIRNYCSGCGTRIKKQSWKFCPTCSEQLD